MKTASIYKSGLKNSLKIRLKIDEKKAVWLAIGDCCGAVGAWSPRFFSSQFSTLYVVLLYSTYSIIRYYLILQPHLSHTLLYFFSIDSTAYILALTVKTR